MFSAANMWAFLPSSFANKFPVKRGRRDCMHARTMSQVVTIALRLYRLTRSFRFSLARIWRRSLSFKCLCVFIGTVALAWLCLDLIRFDSIPWTAEERQTCVFLRGNSPKQTVVRIACRWRTLSLHTSDKPTRTHLPTLRHRATHNPTARPARDPQSVRVVRCAFPGVLEKRQRARVNISSVFAQRTPESERKECVNTRYGARLTPDARAGVESLSVWAMLLLLLVLLLVGVDDCVRGFYAARRTQTLVCKCSLALRVCCAVASYNQAKLQPTNLLKLTHNLILWLWAQSGRHRTLFSRCASRRSALHFTRFEYYSLRTVVPHLLWRCV